MVHRVCWAGHPGPAGVLSVGRLGLSKRPDIGMSLANIATMFDTCSMKALIAVQLCEGAVKSGAGLERVL